jgi:predicted metal-dependent hydrolase
MQRDAGREQLCQRVRYWSQRLKTEARIIRVQRMTRKWGSCSTTGIITLADDLASQAVEFQDFVIVHELLHLRVPNHGRLFKALMSAHVPGWRDHDVRRRQRRTTDVRTFAAA